MPRHGDWQLWKLRESVAYGDGVGVSTDAARDASGARGLVIRRVNDASRHVHRI